MQIILDPYDRPIHTLRVSLKTDEEGTAEAMKAGANDFVFEGNHDS